MLVFPFLGRIWCTGRFYHNTNWHLIPKSLTSNKIACISLSIHGSWYVGARVCNQHGCPAKKMAAMGPNIWSHFCIWTLLCYFDVGRVMGPTTEWCSLGMSVASNYSWSCSWQCNVRETSLVPLLLSYWGHEQNVCNTCHGRSPHLEIKLVCNFFGIILLRLYQPKTNTFTICSLLVMDAQAQLAK